ncbi:MAG: patatin-like phospholipase family protein [Cyclobacteriaceae bacterium]|nr:patatin-like phospholipase family protein [Cyclobacteriaceae bacterium]
MKKVRLVLGSGGARGMAHIGVIEELEKKGFHIVEVVGCSMGAVVGGIYCAGYLSDYKHWLIKLSRLDVFRLLDFTLSAQGFVKGERVFKSIEEFIGDHLIENFKIPFTAVASDITHKKEVHYKSGSLFKALRSSIAIPTVLTPVRDGKSELVDGGVLNPLPLNLINKEPGDWIVAVNLNANIPYKPSATLSDDNKERAYYLKMFDSMMAVLPKFETSKEETLASLGLFDLLNRSYELTQDRLTELMIDVHKPDLVINISRDACGVFEFYRANEIIEEGRKAFHKAYEQHQAHDVTPD